MLHMHGNKIFSRYTIAIRKDQVFSSTGLDGLVQYFRFLEAPVFMPNVYDIKRRPHCKSLDYVACLVTGPIIGYHQFKILVRLAFISPQYLLKPFWRIIGTYDN